MSSLLVVMVTRLEDLTCKETGAISKLVIEIRDKALINSEKEAKRISTLNPNC